MARYNQNNARNLSPRDQLDVKYNTARHNILLVLAFSVINLILLLTDGDSYFLFSACIPYLLVSTGMAMCGKFPPEFYGEEYANLEFLDGSVLTVLTVLAFLLLLLYVPAWIFSSKHRVGWLVFALALFAADSALLLLFNGLSTDMLIDLLFHAFVLYEFGAGIVAHRKWKAMPAEEMVILPPDGAEPPVDGTAEPAMAEASTEGDAPKADATPVADTAEEAPATQESPAEQKQETDYFPPLS